LALPRFLVLLVVPALLAGCLYDFKNPAEVLRAGEASGTVLAERNAPGALEGFPGVSVSLKGSAFDQTTRDSGRFAVLDLPVGRHTLLFRKGTTWSLEREVEVAFGKDGQPEGVDLGKVVLRYASPVEGQVTLPFGNPLASGVAVDETSGQTAVIVPDAPGSATGTYRFPALAVGTHVIKVAARDGLAFGTWVGGQAVVTIAEADQGTTRTVAPITARAATTTGRLRFRVQLVGDPGVTLAEVAVALLPDPGIGAIVPDSQGFVDVTVPEGSYQVSLAATPSPRLSSPAVARSLARPAVGLPVGPPAATGVVLDGKVAEVGSVYVVSDLSISFSARECVATTDCGPPLGAAVTPTCSGRQCFVCFEGTAGQGGTCSPLTPPATPSAAIPFCPACPQRASCEAGPGVTSSCNNDGVCVPICVNGYTFSCTPDGVVTYTSNPSGC
jgi:hypothetical protein